ncbi:MAG: Tetraacyldisaccharide 4'-kinase [uncultured Lysobacter sp.]|uniref:Tetraacyldisaccharide 4'-kinase n=1 Tax=uncultured Lysobacter sp. TaxID=271060 RepID=A0A6J4MIZ1_9GAMM|nr:MAG: Tetraacyldisaccharide 4'-kinase [uncultured Lysobacter sp.]
MSARTPRHWYGDAPVPPGTQALAAVYGGLAGIRRGLFRRGWLRSQHPGVPVIVIGNITAGGAGKTPLTIALAQRLRAEGWTPGIASRGYGRAEDSRALWVDATSDARQVGDEPLLIARRTGAMVRVDTRRAAAARALVQAGCDIVLCDDGLQHYRLARDIEIEVIDGRRRYGNGQLLPAGPLREPPHRAARCDFRVLNLPSQAAGTECGFGEWPMRLHGDQVHPLGGGRVRALDSFAGQRVHAVAGIGDPERFFTMLRSVGVAVVPHAFADHHQYVVEDFAFGSRLPVLMTEKDAVKIPTLRTAGFPIDACFSVPVRAELPEAFWLAFVERLKHVGQPARKGAAS